MKRIRSYHTLPTGYKEKLSINLKDKKILVFLNIGSILLILPFILGYVIYLDLNPYNDPITLKPLDILLYLVLACFSIIIHGIFFKLGTKEKVRYKFHGWAASASVEGIYFYKNHYILTGIAPFIFITPLLVSSIYFFPMHALGLYIILAIHTAGCVGDFYVILKLIRCNSNTLIHDYGIGMTIYKK